MAIRKRKTLGCSLEKLVNGSCHVPMQLRRTEKLAITNDNRVCLVGEASPFVNYPISAR